MSYNSLLTDPDLVARWNGDADGNGTGDANDVQGTYNGTWTGTAAYTDPPTGKGDGKAFDFDGSSYVSAGNAANYPDNLTDFTATVWVNVTSANGYAFCHSAALSQGWAIKPEASIGVRSYVGTSGILVGNDIAGDGWTLLAVVVDEDANTYGLFVNGALGGTGAVGTTTGGSTTYIGSRAGSQNFNDEVFDPRIYTRKLTAAELLELYAGPEPTYTSGATLAANGAYNVGTWSDPSNGTRTYEWVVVEADGTVVDSGTGATGTADFGATTGLLTLLVRTSNDGGYDVGDFATRTSGYGSAGDGYYEVATVTIPLAPRAIYYQRLLRC